jgi:replicative DNA helicase
MAAPRFPHITPREARETEPELIGTEELGLQQYAGALDRLHLDTSQFPRFPWPDLARIAGPMCPEDLVMVMARTGGGKSLFLQNLFDAMVTSGRRGLYVGLEQSAEILRIKWACMRASVQPRLMLAATEEERAAAGWRDLRNRVADQLAWQRTQGVKEAAMFAAARTINAAGLRAWTQWAVDRGADFLVLDHIDRVKHGDGRNPFQEMSDTMRLAKELAVEHQLVMLIASQVGRPQDANEAFIPPALHNARGGGTKEEESDTVLGIYRPLRPEVSESDMKRVRQGFATMGTIVEPNQMGVRVLKHRLDDEALDKVARLAVHHGRVTDLPERDQHATTYDATRRL